MPQKQYSRVTPPPSKISRFFWHCKIWVDATLATCVLELWETLILLFILFMFCLLLVGGIYYYLPSHVSLLARRARYYLVGTDSGCIGAAVPSREGDLY